jgi:hypothetical protein
MGMGWGDMHVPQYNTCYFPWGGGSAAQNFCGINQRYSRYLSQDHPTSAIHKLSSPVDLITKECPQSRKQNKDMKQA